jgi:hypothetical protein
MFQIKFNNKQSVIFNTAFGIGFSLVSLALLFLPSYAGPQSLLDPYADIRPAKESKATGKKAPKSQAKKAQPTFEQTASNEMNEANGVSPSSPAKTKKIKAKANAAPKNQVSKSDNPGFVSGFKEIQHGFMTSFTAAFGGISNGTKAAGAKVADGTRNIGGGMAAASSKVVTVPKNLVAKIPAPKVPKIKKDKTPKIGEVKPAPQNNQELPTLANKPVIPALPGKPLDQSIAQEKQRKKLKDVDVTTGAVANGAQRKPGIITAYVGKFMQKRKKAAPAANLTANNPASIAH